MLNKIRFRGFDIKSSSLEIQDQESEGGKFNVRFNEHKVTPLKDEDGYWLFLDVNPVITGLSNADDQVLFEATVALTLSFECDLKDEIDEKFYDENSWFFENFVFIVTKIAFENLLKGSIIETIVLPWSPKF